MGTDGVINGHLTLRMFDAARVDISIDIVPSMFNPYCIRVVLTSWESFNYIVSYEDFDAKNKFFKSSKRIFL